MRLFVAAYPPPEAVTDAVARVEGLRVGRAAASGINVRLTRPETYHVTLAFLGEVDPLRLPDVQAAITRATANWRPGHDGSGRPAPVVDAASDPPPPGPPRVSFAGGGRFGRGRFTVLWLGLDGDVDALTDLSRALRRELGQARLPYDRKPFRPHLTIARPGERVTDEEVDADRAALAAYAGPEWPVAEVALMRSHLGPRPTYDRLAAWRL
ncbi:2'-5' RNA ligase [Micromonospora pattaloongensis]|uniref:RNA 2',3'-cyclic phosphodiesterase n=1 Tax=Micromonospora pattaloongensis TaxID=405436 RepID=A0A1H3SLE2_9ACTN|nr:2'-5' RNA ligase family protein [Micromonospora pattaloongensis]SDZ38547.1 2'-5' RNA ligase [Micromonospora pattaloongensis]